MQLDYQHALRHFRDWTETDALRRHGRSVELVMRSAAVKYGNGQADSDRWAIAGLLHDADYEKWPDEHPRRIVQWLQDQGEPEIAHAVSCHYSQWGIPAESLLDKALLASDEIAGFISACALIRPDGIATLTVRSVKKKLADKSFAAKVDRDEIRLGCQLLNVSLDDHINLVIEALKPHAVELGLAGRQTTSRTLESLAT